MDDSKIHLELHRLFLRATQRMLRVTHSHIIKIEFISGSGAVSMSNKIICLRFRTLVCMTLNKPTQIATLAKEILMISRETRRRRADLKKIRTLILSVTAPDPDPTWNLTLRQRVALTKTA
jgi:hypothetical protein